MLGCVFYTTIKTVTLLTGVRVCSWAQQSHGGYGKIKPCDFISQRVPYLLLYCKCCWRRRLLTFATSSFSPRWRWRQRLFIFLQYSITSLCGGYASMFTPWCFTFLLRYGLPLDFSVWQKWLLLLLFCMRHQHGVSLGFVWVFFVVV